MKKVKKDIFQKLVFDTQKNYMKFIYDNKAEYVIRIRNLKQALNQS